MYHRYTELAISALELAISQHIQVNFDFHCLIDNNVNHSANAVSVSSSICLD
jgi:hypothetical protein